MRVCTGGLRSVGASLLRGAGILGSWGIWGSYQAQGALVWIFSRVSIFSRTPCPRRPLLNNNNLCCAGERVKGGHGPTQLTLCRDTCINKPPSNSHNSMEGTVGAFAIPCLPQWQLLPQLDTADLDTLGNLPRSEFLKEKLHPAASSSLPHNPPLLQNPMPTPQDAASISSGLPHVAYRAEWGKTSGICLSSSISWAPTTLPGLGTGL